MGADRPHRRGRRRRENQNVSPSPARPPRPLADIGRQADENTRFMLLVAHERAAGRLAPPPALLDRVTIERLVRGANAFRAHYLARRAVEIPRDDPHGRATLAALIGMQAHKCFDAFKADRGFRAELLQMEVLTHRMDELLFASKFGPTLERVARARRELPVLGNKAKSRKTDTLRLRYQKEANKLKKSVPTITRYIRSVLKPQRIKDPR